MNKRFYFGFIGLLGLLGFGDPWYFLFFLFFLFFIFVAKKENKSELIKAKEEQKSENRQKILDFLQDKEKIANNDVEKLLGVSNSTAERHLDQLEKEGVLKQVGKVGRDVYY